MASNACADLDQAEVGLQPAPCRTARQAAQEQILLVAIGAVVAILLLLQSAFRNWRMTMLAFVALPMAVVGGIRLRLKASTGQ